MGSRISAHDYEWSYTDEPHSSRRKEILSKYPQIKELYGFDPMTKYIVFLWVTSQFLVSYAVREAEWSFVVIAAYCFGGFASHALMLAMHEISHNLAFQKPLYNKFLGFFANLPTFVPHFSMFQKYHMEHHQYQGVQGVDTDVPSRWEGEFFTNSLKKMLWVFMQPLFYVTRPLYTKPKKPGFWEAVNWTATIVVDILIWYFVGAKSAGYLCFSAFFGCGLHPVAGHFIAEHYVFIKGQETYSYYGPLNLICFNVGYHNEHHDFPRIPGRRLPEVKKIAAEYYDTLPNYNSWVGVIWSYITDPEVGPFSRVMRKSHRQVQDYDPSQRDKDD
jgi:sphingolipid delta-4 desaturase